MIYLAAALAQSTATAPSPGITTAVEALSVEHSLTESSPHRLRPSTLTARLQAADDPCGLQDPITGAYGGGTWSGDIRGRAASGTYGGGRWSGSVVDGPPISDGRYARRQVSAVHGGSPVVAEWVRARGTRGYAVGATGCQALEAALAGQSNTSGKFFAPHTPRGQPTAPGTLYVGGETDGTGVYPKQLSVEEAWMEAGHTLVKRGVGGSTIGEWTEPGGHWGELVDLADTSGVHPTVTLWIHGEQHSQSRARAEAYADLAADFFDSIEAEWGPQLFLWPRLSLADDPIRPHYWRVNDGMEALAMQRDDLLLIDTEGLPKRDDVHYDYTGYTLLGQRLVAPVEAAP